MLERIQLEPRSIRFWCLWVLGVALGTASVLASAMDSGAADDSVIVRTGGELYGHYCAVCHGLGAAGDGPFSQVLRKPPPNLTQLAARNDGSFPYWQAYEKISGLELLPAHGSREMPIWGEIFAPANSFESSAPASIARGQIAEILAWLRTRQSPP